MTGAVLLGVGPLLLLTLSAVRADRATIFGMNALILGLLLIAAGIVMYPLKAVAIKAGLLSAIRRSGS